jgi:hypothetical protein
MEEPYIIHQMQVILIFSFKGWTREVFLKAFSLYRVCKKKLGGASNVQPTSLMNESQTHTELPLFLASTYLTARYFG